MYTGVCIPFPTYLIRTSPTTVIISVSTLIYPVMTGITTTATLANMQTLTIHALPMTHNIIISKYSHISPRITSQSGRLPKKTKKVIYKISICERARDILNKHESQPNEVDIDKYEQQVISANFFQRRKNGNTKPYNYRRVQTNPYVSPKKNKTSNRTIQHRLKPKFLCITESPIAKHWYIRISFGGLLVIYHSNIVTNTPPRHCT